MMPSSSARRLHRFQWLLSGAWTLAWTLGVVVLASMAANFRDERRGQELDTELIYATMAAYGLSWFDESGRFHDELLLQELELGESDADLWVIQPGEEVQRHFRPLEARFAVEELDAIANTVVASQEVFLQQGVDARGLPYRLRAIPTYLETVSETAHAAIIAVADPAPGLAAHHRFVRRIRWLALLIGVAGIAVGIGLAHWSLRPVAVSMEQRELFLAATAHELRAPLAALRGVAEASGDGGDPRQALARIRELARETSRVVDDLLLFARLDAGSTPLARERIRLDLLVEAQLPESLDPNLEQSPVEIEADPRLLGIAVRNLLENAALHAEGRAVRVRLSPARIVVEDEGPGFPEAVLESAASGKRAQPSERGTGLGLALVQLVAELHGGSLELENRPKGGARATLELS